MKIFRLLTHVGIYVKCVFKNDQFNQFSVVITFLTFLTFFVFIFKST